MKFTTRDRDNDRGGSSYNCAVHNGGGGGWWYNYCSYIPPNHRYHSTSTLYLNGQWYSLPPFIEIKIRSLNCNL